VSEIDQRTKRKTPVGRGRPVTVSLVTPGVAEVGSQTVTVLTNDYGVASFTLTASPNLGSTDVIATDDHSGAKWRGTISVVKPPGIWRLRNLALIGVGVVIVTIALTRNGGPLKQESTAPIP
jgi:hypothetical protein